MEMTTTERFQISNLKTFQYFTSYQVFFFSRDSDDNPRFLLRKKRKVHQFTNISGKSTSSDYSIILALARNFVNKTKGVLASHNWTYFSKDSTEETFDKITLESSIPKLQRQKNFTPAVDDICRLVCESPYQYQDENDEVSFLIEIPSLNIELINKFLQRNNINLQFQEFSFENIQSQRHSIHSKLYQYLDQNPKFCEYVKRFIINKEKIEIREHFAIICCEPIIYTHLLHSLMYPIYKKHGEEWKFYKAFNNELPSKQELSKLKGIIIPGSSQSVVSAEESGLEWYQKVIKLIQTINKEFPKINLLGICFGAQIIAQALGGKVAKMKDGFIQSSEILTIKQELYELPYVKQLNLDAAKPLVIAQSHGEQIIELPPNALELASSKSSEIEIFAIGNNTLAFQGHPDLNEGWAKQMVSKDGNNNHEHYPISHQEFSMICYHFIKKEPEGIENQQQ